MMPRMPTADMAETTRRPTFTSATKIDLANGITAKALSAVMVETHGANQKMALSDSAGMMSSLSSNFTASAMKKLNLDADEMARILGTQSGLAGISGTSGDMRDLDEAAAAGSKRARLALDVFVRAIRHYLG